MIRAEPGELAGFDRDDVGGRSTDTDDEAERGNDIRVWEVAVQQQHLDQRLSTTEVAMGFAGAGPERLMRGGEDPRLAGLHERGRAR